MVDHGGGFLNEFPAWMRWGEWYSDSEENEPLIAASTLSYNFEDYGIKVRALGQVDNLKI